MHFAVVAVLAVFAFAGRALALNIVVAGVGNLTASQFLQFPTGPYTQPCSPFCNSAVADVTACGDTNDACLCSTNTTTDILDCEQCMFNQLVQMNMKQPSPLVGNNVVVGDYATACNSSLGTMPKMALVTPPEAKDLPTDIILDLPSTVVVVGFGAFLGFSALYLLCSIA